MNNQILIILGSPRKKGNSAILAYQLAKGARSSGNKVEIIYLNGKDIKPCQSCQKCLEESSKGCIIKDDMQQIYPELIASDYIVLVTPIYFYNMSGQMKIFIDRWFAYTAHPKRIRDLFGKHLILIFTFAEPDPYLSGAINAIRCFQDISQIIKVKSLNILYGQADKLGEINNNKILMQRVLKLGQTL